MKRIGGLVLILSALALPALHAQYFGQNKVHYESFDFKIIQTEHFDVYFYPEERAAALDAARMAERSYARLTRVLNHRFTERKPIIVYASHSQFQQTNISDIPEGVGGQTDFFKQRNILPFTGSYADFDHVLTHEMVHQFQYDIWSRGKAGAGIQTIIQLRPPGWFVEGMAEYLSLGRIDANTAMWLRDAALEGDLPTIEQLTYDPRIFPYRFGHAILAYIGERWGDEAIGAILNSSVSGSLEGAFRRVIGLNFDQLSDQWRDAVQKKYLPQIGDRVKARTVASELLTEKRSDGTVHLAPALSPDGSKVAYFSEKNTYFIDLYLADGNTGRVEGRLLKSSFSANYETFRFINSGVDFAPDGRRLVLAAKSGPRDDIVIVDVDKKDEIGRIKVPLDGVTTPSWSPDGTRIVFTGYDGGLSDLFVVNQDGSDLQRLTNDKYAAFHPVWSPDGKTIAFSTDRGPETNFDQLKYGNFRIALYHLDSGNVEVLDQMQGRNSSPQWSPDGNQIAFVSDRDGVSNIYMYDLTNRSLSQITNFYTGVQGIIPLAPVLSWARDVDRLAFVYYEDSNYDVYTLSNPRSYAHPPRPVEERPNQLAAVAPDVPRAAPADTGEASGAVRQGGSVYRTPSGFRESDSTRTGIDSLLPNPVSIQALLDSTSLNLPDTSEFTIRDYNVKLTPDYIARPSIGYTRDTFGNGFFGGTTIALSDILNNHTLIFSGYVNGRLTESQILAAYLNQEKRVNWITGVSQDPYFFLEPSEIRPGEPTSTENTLVTNIRRLVIRSAFGQAYYPINRFRRIEAGVRVANVDDARLSILEPYDPGTGFATRQATLDEQGLNNVTYAEPSVALVHDNTIFGYTGPLLGRRSRFELAQTIGGWTFTQATADYRRYDHLFGPFTFATRALYFGRLGRDADQFQVFLGSTELLRGNTSGSYRRNECLNSNDIGTQTGCAALDRLVGTQIALASAELRFPLLNASLGFVPIGFPPIEGALFYDVGMAWRSGNTLKFSRDPGDSPVTVRTPMQTIGASIRMNVLGILILRLDWSNPLNRDGVNSLWTLSLGPTF